MRLNNLGISEKQRLKSGDVKFLKKLLEEEYEEVKEDLVTYPLDSLERLRGKARELSLIIELLP